MNHTPGPWKVLAAVQNNGPDYFVILNQHHPWGEREIARAYDPDIARLLSMAPELVRTLKLAQTQIIEWLDGDNRENEIANSYATLSEVENLLDYIDGNRRES